MRGISARGSVARSVWPPCTRLRDEGRAWLALALQLLRDVDQLEVDAAVAALAALAKGLETKLAVLGLGLHRVQTTAEFVRFDRGSRGDRREHNENNTTEVGHLSRQPGNR